MKLKLKQTNSNQFPTVGVFIEGDSIRKCLNELLEKELDLKLCQSYLIPSFSEHKLLGLLIILNIEYNKNLFNKHIPIHCVMGKIYIPSGSVISPVVTQHDLNTKFYNSSYFWHPKNGLLELGNEFNWANVLNLNLSESVEVKKPNIGARIPHGIKSFNLDIDLGKLLDKLEESPFGNLFNSKDNPYFDYEKLLKGNKKELDKFLKLMHSNPELAMQYAIPLDTLNKLRVNNYANYKFNSFNYKLKNFLNGVLGYSSSKNVSSSSANESKPYEVFLIILLSFVLVAYLFNSNDKSVSYGVGVTLISNLVVLLLLYILVVNFNKSLTTKKKKRDNNVDSDLSNKNVTPLNYNHRNYDRVYNTSGVTESNENGKNKKFTLFWSLFLVVFLLLIANDFINLFSEVLVVLLKILVAVIAIISFFNFIKKRIKEQKDDLYNNQRGSNATIMDSDSFKTLKDKYETMAQNLVEQKDYKQASYIYYKLLTNPLKAAETLKTGKHYQEAAIMYLKKCNDKSNAAECFELAKAYKSAVDLYIELKLDEKVGDMYCLLNNRKEAMKYYKVKFDNLINENMYLSAAELAGNKMNDESLSQSTYLKGWEFGNNKVQCLYQYFKNVEDLNDSLNSFYNENIKLHNSFDFLTVLKKLKKVNSEIDETSLNLAYKIISTNAHLNPFIVSELLFFNNEDKHLEKDIFRFKNNNGKKKKN